MNFIIAGLGTNITLGLISATTNATNNLYTLCNNISESSSNNSNDIKQIIKDNDLEVKIKIIQFILCEININENSSCTLNYCINSVNIAIKYILDELEKINYRIQYNNNLWFGSSVRSYGFKNSKLRLKTYIDTLELRYNMLINILSIENKLYKNSDLVESLSKSIMTTNKIDIQSISKIKNDLHKRLEFVNT